MKFLSVLVLMFSLTTAVKAQEVNQTKGDIAVLKEEPSINIEFTYNKMTVGDYGKEENFIKTKKSEYNAKEAGKGDSWAAEWVGDRERKYHPMFIKAFGDGGKLEVKPESKYTLIFNTDFCEPGYSVGVAKKNAQIDGTATIVETANRSKVIAVFKIEHPGESMFRGAAFDAATRIGQAYSLTAKKLAAYIKKNAK